MVVIHLQSAAPTFQGDVISGRVWDSIFLLDLCCRTRSHQFSTCLTTVFSCLTVTQVHITLVCLGVGANRRKLWVANANVCKTSSCGIATCNSACKVVQVAINDAT